MNDENDIVAIKLRKLRQKLRQGFRAHYARNEVYSNIAKNAVAHPGKIMSRKLMKELRKPVTKKAIPKEHNESPLEAERHSKK